MALTIYGCKGSCGQAVSEEDFNAGKHVCNFDGCSHLGQPLVKKLICDKCGKDYFDNEVHVCDF